MRDGLVIANLLGATAVIIGAFAAYALNVQRYRFVRLGRRRMLAPWVRLMQAIATSVPLMAFFVWTLRGQGMSTTLVGQVVYALAWASAAGWVIPVLQFELRHNPTGPPAPPGERQKPSAEMVRTAAVVEDEAYEQLRVSRGSEPHHGGGLPAAAARDRRAGRRR